MLTPGLLTGFAPSRHNLVGPVADSDRWFIMNPLSRQADLISAQEAQQLLAGQVDVPAEWVAKGYLVDPAEEQARFRRAYLDFLEAREADELQLFFVPWYACNFACHYCFQAPYEPPRQALDPAVIAAFFAHVDQHFAGRSKYLTLFGGEPLLPGEAARESIARLLEGARARDLEVAVVTNGHELVSYLPLLQTAKIREIQVTLDGPPEIHDQRRPLRGGAGTFERVAAAIDAALALDLPVNVRAVVDRDNIEHLPALADVAIARGWTRHPRFKTQLGRNYELHHCHSTPGQLYTRLELYQELYRLIGQHPQLQEFHRPSFSIARFLFDHQQMPEPLFDACPATKSEWAFDYSGSIYSCTATVGKQGEVLGTFFPEATLDAEAVAAWSERDVVAIDACRSCSSALACGGGCGSVARNRTGQIQAPDCRPIVELLTLGTGAYLAKDA